MYAIVFNLYNGYKLRFRGLLNMMDNDDILKIIGNNIKIARRQMDYTQERLAEELNTSDKFVSMIERGASGLSITNIVNLCRILNIEPNTLFNGIIDYNNDKDTYIVNSLSTLTPADKDFIISVIQYVLKKGSK